MGESYLQARKWADKFLESQRRQLALWFDVPLTEVKLSDAEADYAGCDATIKGIRIALRVRRYAVWKNIGPQIVLRTSKSTKGDTRNEVEKVRDGEVDYLLISYADEASSSNSTGDTLLSNILVDLGPVSKAAQNEFKGVRVSEISADRAMALCVELASLMAMHGPCIVAQETTTIDTHSDTTHATNHQTGLRHSTTETETIRRRTEAHNPNLLEAARLRASAA